MKKQIGKVDHFRILALAALVGAIVFFAYDLAEDALLEGEFGSSHFVIEFVVFVGVSMALVVSWRDLGRLHIRLDREEWRNHLYSSVLADSIDEQMDEWRLTRSEKDVAWLVIKGYRFSEIAQLRGVKENTSRLQATSVYAKAGVSGRAEFVAEVLQPLLMSIPARSAFQNEEPRARTPST